MVICSCHGVSDRRVRREIDHGATSIEEIADRCKAGSCCLSCHPSLDALIAERCPEATVVARRGRRFVMA
jgi:bacterioferritin-associated ferredoxin